MTTPSGLLAPAQPYWIDALIPDFGDGMFQELLGGNTYFFAFPLSLPGYDFVDEDGVLYLQFNAAQQEATRAIFGELAGIVDLQFVETLNPGQFNTIALANNFQAATAGYTYYPSSSFLGSDVFLDRTTSANISMRDGTSGPLTLVHEIGHALGLKHPFSFADAGGDPGEPPFLSQAEDTARWTVMSYNSTPADYHADFAPLDIAALQYLYGPSPTARAGDDTYLLNPFGPSFFWDGGGYDTIDAAHLGTPLTFSLEPGHWSHAGAKGASITAPGQITVNYGSVFEGLRGGSGADWLDGNGVANDLRGNGGNDTIYGEGGDDLITGGLGTDTAGYLGALSSYSLTRTSSGYTITDAVAGRDGSDSLAEIELLRFSDRTVDLAMPSRAASIEPGALKTLQELYVGFFNRIPEAHGLAYWIERVAGGASLEAVANQFHDAGVQFGLYAAGMSDAQFVQTVYANVLARPSGAPTAPNDSEVGFWAAQLATGITSKGALVLQMLDDVHTVFADDPVWGFVSDLLDNKALVANYYAVELGLGLNTEQANIDYGRALVTLVTPTDTAAAIALIGQSDFALLA
jgi:serralysin